MHEVVLTESLVELMEGESRSRGFSRAARLELGGVDPDTMPSCFDAVAKGALLEGARLDIAVGRGQGWRLDCAEPVEVYERFAVCPPCGRRHVQAAEGDELRLKELEVE